MMSVLDDWVSVHGEELMLPALDFTPKQLFWISAASTFCSNEKLEGRILEDVHSPYLFRVQVENITPSISFQYLIN